MSRKLSENLSRGGHTLIDHHANVSIRVKAKKPFTPGHGGEALLVVNKDRHGGVRANCPFGDREPVAGTFKLLAFNDGVLEWQLTAPIAGERNDDDRRCGERRTGGRE